MMRWTWNLRIAPKFVVYGAALVGDTIYAFGGCLVNTRQLQMRVFALNTNTLQWKVVDPLDDISILLRHPQVPSHFFEHTTVVYNNKIYLAGGIGYDGNMELYCLEPETATWSRPEVSGTPPVSRDKHTACVSGKYMYVYGGFVYVLRELVRDLHILNLETFEWQSVETFGPSPYNIYFHAAAAINNRMYIFGGQSDEHFPDHSYEESYSSAMYYLDLETKEWHKPTTTGNSPLGHRGHEMVLYNGIIYVFASDQNMFYSILYSFNTENNVWSKIRLLGKPPIVRKLQSTVVKGTRLFVFSGEFSAEDRDLSVNNDTHVLDFAPSMKTLAAIATLDNELDISSLPRTLHQDVLEMARIM